MLTAFLFFQIQLPDIKLEYHILFHT